MSVSLNKMSRPTLYPCNSKASVAIQYNGIESDENVSNNKRDVTKFWEVRSHCSTLLIPAAYPELSMPTCSGQYEYLLHSTNLAPGPELVSVLRQAYYQVLARLESSANQSKNFILSPQLIKLKNIDPYSRQRIVEKICTFLRSQKHLRSVVLEQAGLSLTDLCSVLVALARNSQVKRLYLWGALDPCHVPFKGPLEIDHLVDDIPRIPFTYNPGGRKYLRELERRKNEEQQKSPSKFYFKTGDPASLKTMTKSEAASLVVWLENLIQTQLLTSELKLRTEKRAHKEIEHLHEDVDERYFVYTQCDVGVQCDEPQELSNFSICHEPKKPTDKTKEENEGNMELLRIRCKLEGCKDYMKLYEHTELHINVLRTILRTALSGFVNVTTLSVNYSLLADGTGETLMSIGSLLRGRLLDLELLCDFKDLPWSDHQQFELGALHAIPNQTWHHVKQICPRLQVHLVCMWLLPYDLTRKFMTKSIPLYSLHINDGFCPTLKAPQLMFFSTLKFMGYYFKQTIEVVDIVLWHSSGRIDSALEIFLVDAPNLRSFSYQGPLQLTASVSRLCEAALRPSSGLVSFKLMVQGDPCYSHVAHQVTQRLYTKYLPKFADRSISFMLGTHNSSKSDSRYKNM